MSPSRRALLRSFLALPVAVKLAPFATPEQIDVDLFVLSPGYGYLAEALRRRLITSPGRFLPSVAADPPFLVSPAIYAALTDGAALPPEPTEFYEGDFFGDPGKER